MNACLAARYYRLALRSARERDISGAARYAQYACVLDGQHTDAAFLLELCLRELGRPLSPAPENGGEDDGLDQVRALARRKKWREAARAACAVPGKSARVLNIQGCLFALAQRPREAADRFARALAADRGSRLAAVGFAETFRPRKKFWEIW
ncbi:MAG: hypothetical protein LBS37_03755 [Treponema sp.]|jgi:hypothetical protein|nr:hypothetical protein [Treponema sp.]